MYILVDVDDPSDVGKNERGRYLIREFGTYELLKTKELLFTRVHPATPKDD